MILQINITDKT